MQQRVNAIDQDISRSVKTDPSMHELGLFCLVKIARLVTLLFLRLSYEIVGGIGVRLQLLRQFDISFLEAHLWYRGPVVIETLLKHKH